ncbi:Uncharacterised protein [Mycobacteroides abscessus subsp. abscessus]|nr:Uncharacterised protein [Mycobacteroides abscessus subsp. abscessus]
MASRRWTAVCPVSRNPAASLKDRLAGFLNT